MGDGRYYTFYQFWGIVILVSLSIVVLMSMIVGYYKNRGNKNHLQLLHLFFGLCFLVVVKIIEFVIPDLTAGMILRSLFGIFLFLMIIEWFNYLNINFLHFKEIYHRYVVWGILLFIAIITFMTKGNLLFEQYQFYHTKFHLFYVICWIVLSTVALLFVILSALVRRKIHKIYANITVTGMLIIFIFLPLLFYTITLYINANFIDFAEINILATLTASLNIVMYNQTPSGITVLTFEKIGDIINDYILVTDINGKIIYRNKAVLQSDFFVKKESIKLEQIEEIYRSEAILKRDEDGDQYIHLMDGEDNYYLGHQVDTLKNNEELIGYIITIVDISELVELLKQLREMELQAKEVNEQLANYAEIVYNVEKENQINILLEKILSTREEDVERLIDQINELIESENYDDEKLMQERIDHVIKYNQQIIDEVRKTVNSYR